MHKDFIGFDPGNRRVMAIDVAWQAHTAKTRRWLLRRLPKCSQSDVDKFLRQYLKKMTEALG